MDAETTRAMIDRVRAWTPERRRAAGLRVLEHPQLFDVEAASACNIVCSFCPREEMQRPMRLMDERTLDRLAEFLPDDAVVMFSGLGESILNPRLERLISSLKRRSISSSLITNGVRLLPARQRSLIEAGLDEVQISVHGLDRETLSSIVTRGAAPERVHENLEHLARTRPSGLRVRVNFVETAENAAATARVEAWARSLGFHFYYRRLHNRGGSLASLRNIGENSGCGIFAAVTFITVEGNILSCVNDVRGAEGLGSIFELDWPALKRKKAETLETDRWFGHCRSCNDDYRWIILGQDGVGSGSFEGA